MNKKEIKKYPSDLCADEIKYIQSEKMLLFMLDTLLQVKQNNPLKVKLESLANMP